MVGVLSCINVYDCICRFTFMIIYLSACVDVMCVQYMVQKCLIHQPKSFPAMSLTRRITGDEH